MQDRASAIRVVDGSAPTLVGDNRGHKQYVADGEVVIHSVHFPATLTSFQRERITDYGSEAGGYSVGYTNPDGTYLTLYVYGDGADIAAEMEQVKAGIAQIYQQAKVLLEGPIGVEIKTDGGAAQSIQIQWLRMSYSYEGNEIVSDSMVLAAYGHYVKARMSFPAARADDVLMPLAEVLTALQVVPAAD
jgi:hypothetical protein